MEINTELLLGDCKEELKKLPENSVDLIFTSPPYADQRKKTYGGIHPDNYVEWFLPTTEQLLRVLKPKGTFILNIIALLSRKDCQSGSLNFSQKNGILFLTRLWALEQQF